MLAHYLPRFYLAGFTSAEVPVGQEPFVFFYDLAEGRWRRRSPANLARIPDYYAIEDSTGRRHQDIEAAFAVVEDRMADLLRRKIVLREELSVTDRVRIAEFVALLFLRVPVQQAIIADQLQRIGEENARRLYHFVREEPARLDEIKREIQRTTGVEITPDFSVDDLDPDQYTVEPTRNAVIVQGFRLLDTLVPHLAAMGWGISFAPKGSSFVTSDAPVFLHADRSTSDSRPVAFTDEDVQITCALSSSLALYATPKIERLEYKEVTASAVEQINIRTAARAETIIIANSEKPSGYPGLLQVLGRSTS